MFTKLAKRFLKDEQGIEMAEYAVMLALIIGVVALLAGALSTAIGNRFQATADTIDAGTSP